MVNQDKVNFVLDAIDKTKQEHLIDIRNQWQHCDDFGVQFVVF